MMCSKRCHQLRGGGTNLILSSCIFGAVLPTTQPILHGIEQTLHQWKQLDVLYPGVPKKLGKYHDVIVEFPPKIDLFLKNVFRNFLITFF